MFAEEAHQPTGSRFVHLSTATQEELRLLRTIQEAVL
jgi:hypothetical protein